jgi:hypothetical protein
MPASATQEAEPVGHPLSLALCKSHAGPRATKMQKSPEKSQGTQGPAQGSKAKEEKQISWCKPQSSPKHPPLLFPLGANLRD